MTQPLAIIGMAGRLPGCRDPRALFELLRAGRGTTRRISEQQWRARSVEPALSHASLVEDIDQFDADFFRITPREAALMDPQQRLLLQVSWHALEDAGLVPDALAGSDTGVFVGISGTGYAMHAGALAEPTRLTGVLPAIAANRISYSLGLNGPSMSIDTACSSSLVALHQAQQYLSCTPEARFAIVAGASLILESASTRSLQAAGVLAPDGRCKTFDARADGYGRGEGVVAVVLERVEDALEQSRRSYAIVRGSALVHDGASNGLMAPNGLAQRAVITKALARARVRPEQVAYVEAHGTGTKLGDAIEVKALAEVFGGRREACRLGSLKASLGHLEAAAGLAAVIKTALMLHHRTLVPSLNFEQPNPLLQLERRRLEVQTRCEPWPEARPFAGVSSFGIGGCNAHAILQAAPSLAAPRSRREGAGPSLALLPLSARDPAALRRLAGTYATVEAPALAICRSASIERAHHAHRLVIPVSLDRTDAREQLREHLLQASTGETPAGAFASAGRHRRGSLEIGLLCTGQGSAQDIGELLELDPPLRSTLEGYAHVYREVTGERLFDNLAGLHDEGRAAIVQPAHVTVQLALLSQLQRWGLAAVAVMGHSLGELVAAVAAGVFSAEQAIVLAGARGRSMDDNCLESGAMLSVELPAAELPELAAGLAVDNGARSVLAGTLEAVAEAEAWAAREGVRARRLRTTHAFHSPLIEPALDAWREALGELPARAPTLAFASTLHGDWASPELAQADYWVEQVRAPVRFGSALEQLASRVDLVVELGPGKGLASLARRHLGEQAPRILASAPLSQVAAQLYVEGAELDWDALSSSAAGLRCDLPAYPFARQRHWLASTPASEARASQASSIPAPPERVSEPVGSRPQTIEATLRERIAQLAHVAPEGLDLERSLDELGLSSLDRVEVEETLCTALGLSMLPQPLTSGTSLRELLESLRGLEAPPRTIAFEPRRALSRRPGNTLLDGRRVLVDPNHSFFFDHPYDHVPGLLFVEAIQQLGESLAGPGYASSLQLQFTRWADLDADLRIDLQRIDEAARGRGFAGRIVSENSGKACVQFEARWRTHAGGRSTAEGTPSFTPLELQAARKRRPENVIVGQPSQRGADWLAPLLALDGQHPLCDRPDAFVSATHLLEAARQLSAALVAFERGRGEGERFILLGASVRISEPLYRNEELWLRTRLDRGDEHEGATRATQTLELLRAGRVVGELSMRGALSSASRYANKRFAG